MLAQVEHPGYAEPVQVPGVPVRLSVTPGGVHQRAPMLAEHTREILLENGFSTEQIDELIGQAAAAAR